MATNNEEKIMIRRLLNNIYVLIVVTLLLGIIRKSVLEAFICVFVLLLVFLGATLVYCEFEKRINKW